MKQSRRWAAWLSALMLAASLTVMPREGAAWTPYIDTVDAPSTEGEPDVPSGPARAGLAVRAVARGSLLVLSVGQVQVILYVPWVKARTPQGHAHRSAVR